MAATCIQGRTGLKQDSPDSRDYERVYGAPTIPSTVHYPVVDLRKYVNHVYEQGKLGSCAVNAVCATFELQLRRRAKEERDIYYHFDASRLFLYYNSRVYDNTTDRDDGISLRKAIKSLYITGVCEESLWPYEVTKFSQRPTQNCYDDATQSVRSVYRYERLQQNIDQLRTCLKEGFPFAFGFELYKKSFCISHNGVMPLASDQEILSEPKPEKHGVLAVGYDDRIKYFTILNSWGTSFGDNGYFYMPYKYIETPDRAFDFWKIENFSINAIRQAP